MTDESILYIFKFPKVCILIVAFIGNVSYSELGLEYGILNHGVIGSWIKKYKKRWP